MRNIGQRIAEKCSQKRRRHDCPASRVQQNARKKVKAVKRREGGKHLPRCPARSCEAGSGSRFKRNGGYSETRALHPPLGIEGFMRRPLSRHGRLSRRLKHQGLALVVCYRLSARVVGVKLAATSLSASSRASANARCSASAGSTSSR